LLFQELITLINSLHLLILFYGNSVLTSQRSDLNDDTMEQ